MEKNEGEKGNKKFVLIGIGLILILGIFWVVNNVDYKNLFTSSEEIIDNVSNSSSMNGINKFFGYNYLNGFIFIFSIIALVGGTYILLRGIGIIKKDEDYEEDKEGWKNGFRYE